MKMNVSVLDLLLPCVSAIFLSSCGSMNALSPKSLANVAEEELFARGSQFGLYRNFSGVRDFKSHGSGGFSVKVDFGSRSTKYDGYINVVTVYSLQELPEFREFTDNKILALGVVEFEYSDGSIRTRDRAIAYYQDESWAFDLKKIRFYRAIGSVREIFGEHGIQPSRLVLNED